MRNGKKIEYIRSPIRANDLTGYINLSSNECGYGRYAEYPNSYYLYELLAEVKRVEVDNLLLTKGSEEGIKTVFESILRKGDKIIRPSPTFGMLDVFEHNYGIKATKLVYDEERFVSIYANLKKKYKMLYIANPDNPTGIYRFDIEDIIATCEKLDIIVLLDIVYLPYAITHKLDTIEKHLVNRYSNVIIVNSFSKSHGLAGVRSGYIMSNKKLIRKMREYRPMNELTTVALAETEYALLERKDYYKNLWNVNKWKSRFEIEFPEYSINTYTNFILLHASKQKIKDWNKELIDNRIITRMYLDVEGMPDTLRISIGRDEIMHMVFDILKEME